MNDERPREIRERVENATPGPWDSLLSCEVELVHGDPPRIVGALPEQDRVFCCHARQDIPDLLAALAESDALLARACHDSHQFDLGREAERAEIVAMIRQSAAANLRVGVWSRSAANDLAKTIESRGPTARVPLHETEADNARLRNVLRAIVEGSAGVREAREALEGT